VKIKKAITIVILGIAGYALFAQTRVESNNLTKFQVQVVNQEVINISGSEAVWLPGLIQDKLKSNLQEYLGFRTVVDSKSESMIKKLQSESENSARDEASAIELGKITTAKFVVFTKLRKTAAGYTLSADFTDLTTGEQLASATSKEYSKTEYLYGSTGAVDEITLAIGNKLGIKISDITKNLLTSGSSNFSLDDQLALAIQNEEQFRKQMSNYDEELSKLMVSDDINAVQNKRKLEAEKALLAEKQNAERKRLEDFREQKARAEADAKLEIERSVALKTQRDQLAKDAIAKAAEVRKLKIENQGVLGQINVIESKKKALVEIRQSVEGRSLELYDQMQKDKKSEENRIRNKTYSTVEMENGEPTEQAIQRREKQILKSNQDLLKKFFADCDSVKQSTMAQQNALITEIQSDLKSLSATRTINSMGDELKVSFGTYASSKIGWNAYLSIYTDGVFLQTYNFIIDYESLSGKKAPDMATELDDEVIEEYTNNVDMYNSLLMRGDPIIYFEIDYNVIAEADNKPSQYKFNFSKIRIINTVTGKTVQTSDINKIQSRTMVPEWDLREFAGIVEKEKAKFNPDTYKTEFYMTKGMDYINAKKTFERDAVIDKMFSSFGIKMVDIPTMNIKMLNTEVTQKLYTSIMGSNPSEFEGENNPVETVSWFDALYFCNKLSEKYGLTPVYSIAGTTDVTKWNYKPHDSKSFKANVEYNTEANGFRLPTEDEWEFAAKGGQNYKYSGSNNIDEVAWYRGNTIYDETHPVAQKKANGYGLYDMSGNVWEWCWGTGSSHYISGHYYSNNYSNNYSYNRGGSSANYEGACEVSVKGDYSFFNHFGRIGFRIVRNSF